MHKLVEESHITLLIKFYSGVKKIKLCNDHLYNLTEKVLDHKGIHDLTLKWCRTLKEINIPIFDNF